MESSTTGDTRSHGVRASRDRGSVSDTPAAETGRPGPARLPEAFDGQRRDDPQARLTHAGWRDVEALSVVIAEAVHKLELYRWLVPAPVARWDILLAYFRILLNQALSTGEVYTNRDRTAVAVWLRRGDGRDENPATTTGKSRPRPARGPTGSAPSTRSAQGTTRPVSVTTT